MQCNRKKIKLVSDNTKVVVGLGKFVRSLGRRSAEASKKLATTVMKNPERALEFGAETAGAASSEKPKAALSAFSDVKKLSYRKRASSLKNCKVTINN